MIENRGTAVVVGASVAGLLAAAALAERFQRVMIVERDVLPALGQGRRAVPQGRHVHALLASGERCLNELLPGFSDELLAAGALRCAGLAEMRIELAGHPLCRQAPAADCLLAGRPLIEGHIRRRVLGLPNVAVLQRQGATALVPSADGLAVAGVRVQPAASGSAADVLDADLVVAASGRGGGVAAWLQELGYPRVTEDRLAVDLTYASRRLRLRPGALAADKLIIIGARPGLPRGMALFAQEGGARLLTLAGYGAEHRPPVDERAFLDFAAAVAPPEVLAAIGDAEPLSEIVTHGFAANLRRRYERLPRFPHGLLVIGDAITSFNPLYGQGMSVAALEAVELRRCLAEGTRGLSRRFFRSIAKILDHAWEMAVSADLALPEIAGHRSTSIRIGNAYTDRLLRVAERDPVVAAAFADVGDLLKPPAHVLRPRILWRVLRGQRRASRAGRVPVPSA